jgi:hypothetical protein
MSRFYLISLCIGGLFVASQPQAQANNEITYVSQGLAAYCNNNSKNQDQYNDCMNYTLNHYVACRRNGGWGHNQSTGVDLNIVDYCIQSARAKHTRLIGGRPNPCDARGCLRRPGGGIIGPLD